MSFFICSWLLLLVNHGKGALMGLPAGRSLSSHDLQLRLRDGARQTEGILEIRRRRLGTWSRVCAEGFDDRAATVVCRQLRLAPFGQAKVYVEAGEVYKPKALDGVLCDGTESELNDCYLNGWTEYTCPHYESAGVVCSEESVHPPKEHHCPPGSFGYRCSFQCRCSGGARDCSAVTGTCPGGCALGFWGPGCQLSDSCFYNRQERKYMGRVNRTRDGTPCQAWSSQRPQEHQYEPDHFPDGAHPHNYCRTTSDSQRPWCYGTYGKRWQYCEVNDCACPVGLFGHNCVKMCHCKNQTENCGRKKGFCESGCEEGWTGCDCQTEAVIKTSPAEYNKTRALRALLKSKVTAQTVKKTRSVMEQAGETSAEDVVMVASILQQASQLTISSQTATDMLTIVDRVAELDLPVLQESNADSNTTNRLVMVVDQAADRLSPVERKVVVETNTTSLHVWNLTTAVSNPLPSLLGLQLLTDGRTVPADTTIVGSLSSDSPDQYSNVVAAVMLSGRDIGRQLQEDFFGRDVRLSASVIQQTGLFQEDHRRSGPDLDPDTTDMPRNQTTSQTAGGGSGASQEVRLNSNVVSMRITMDGQPVTDLSASGLGHVTTVFQPLQTLTLSSEELQAGSRCVFWDFALQQGRGGWSEEGCHLDSIHSGRVVCRCDHLTHFAVLMDVTRPGESWTPIHDTPVTLNTATRVGVVMSICALTVTLLAILLVRKLRQSLLQQTLFNVVLAMLLSWVTFLAGIQRVESHVTCVAVAMLLHYSILVTFMWTLVQSYLYYVILAKGRARPEARYYLLKAAVLAWGLPMIPVILVSAIDVDLYRGDKRYCWMSSSPFYYGFLEPLAVVVAVTIILYVLLMINVCRWPRMSRGGRSGLDVSGYVSCVGFSFLGLSWVFAFFALRDSSSVCQVLFAFTAALLGLLLFVRHTAIDPDVQAFCLNAVCCRARKSPGAEHEDEGGSNVPHMMFTMDTSLDP
ncbi:adhesion G protein-coupled receptor L3-like isoform X2 [Babylonia areolata]|uniref:adhesion G protein-coupled receptor L3-like isoform X2 n=1 Tax=Babylonia areolata TaxID=304850 RepID=UPI003FD39C37